MEGIIFEISFGEKKMFQQQQSLPPYMINNEIDRLNKQIESQIREAEDRCLDFITFGLYSSS